jgi:hypothetical protein
MKKTNVPKGKRLLIDWPDKPNGEFHGPREVDIPDGISTQLLDEIPYVEPPEVTKLKDQEKKVSTKDDAASRKCSKTDCMFYKCVLRGSEPCSKCKNLSKGDYYVSKS